MRPIVSAVLLLSLPIPAIAQPNSGNDRQSGGRFGLHFQTTYIYQYSGRFHTPYSGPNSLNGNEEKENSLTMTLFGGARLWKGAEVYVNPEIAGGSGLSGATGMAGSSNGETTRVGDPSPTLYLGRAFIRQTFAIGGGQTDTTEDGLNSLPGVFPHNRLRLYLGKFSLGDVFDQNAVSNSPRTQFMNWALMNMGAWDFAANVRGYTLAAVAELALGNSMFKIGVAELPREANGDALSPNLSQSFSVNLEIDQDYKLHGRTGTIRLLAFHNRTHMGSYAEALSIAAATNTIPDVIGTREEGRTKTGIVINGDQEINNQMSAFFRAGWNDGKTETWCFTEIDQSLAIGAGLKGNSWKRPNDRVGFAIAINGLSKDHRNYLAAGGMGFIIGDGRLNYAPETIGELYYNILMHPAGLWLTADYQLCLNPGYNRDRGPASIASIRLHVEI